MLNRLFDSPAQLLILVLIIVLLFGATRLPNVARQLGRSMRIFKSEMKEMRQDGGRREDETGAPDGDGDEASASGPAPLEGRVVDDRDTRGDRPSSGTAEPSPAGSETHRRDA